ncbi:hypothetical protein FPV67DRAFT_1783351 [Lyophyllum atratum]|nr:hypothetical protein FPV67DRAFT_1783351 [Lyophyllum atratum]
MLPAHLPQDIIDSIIEQFSPQNDTPTLQQCALISRSCLSPARKKLFSEIVLEINALHAPKRCQRLYQVISDHPNVLSYIKKLEISNSPWPLWVEQNAADFPILPRLLEMLVDHGDLRELVVNRYECGPRGLPPSLSQVLLKLVKMPTLHTIEFEFWDTCDIPLDDIVLSPQLKNLRLVGKATPRNPDCIALHIPPPSLPRQLKTLKIGGWDFKNIVPCLTKPQLSLSFSCIRSLTLFSSSVEIINAAVQVMEHASSTIECLSWEYPGGGSGNAEMPWYHPMSLGTLTRLRTLIILAEPMMIPECTIRDLLTRSDPRQHQHSRACRRTPCPRSDMLDEALASICDGRSRSIRVTVWAFVEDPASFETELAAAGSEEECRGQRDCIDDGTPELLRKAIFPGPGFKNSIVEYAMPTPPPASRRLDDVVGETLLPVNLTAVLMLTLET